MTTRLMLLLVLIVSSQFAASAHAGPNDVVILIGNREYRGDVPKVEYAVRDAQAFAKAARDVLGVRPENIKDLSNLDVVGFRRWFGDTGDGSPQLSALVKAKDARIYLFYSGHGMPAEQPDRTYLPVLLPVDALPENAAKEAYRIEWVTAALTKLRETHAPEGRVVLFIDACFSGSSAAGTLDSKSSRVELRPSLIQNLEPRTGITGLMAAESNQVAYWDKQRQHGAFTDALLDGLYGEAADSEGRVTAERLVRFVEDRVGQRLGRLYPRETRRQTPVLQGDGKLVLASLAKDIGARPIRDEQVAAREDTLCLTLPASSEAARLEEYLRSCRLCVCRDRIEARLRELLRLRTVCEAESQELERIAARGAAARSEIEALARSARCEAVRVQAGERLASLAPVRPQEAPIVASPADPASSVQPGSGRSFRDCPECPEMVVVPAGSFVMGSPANEEGRDNDEGPQRTVTIRQAFAAGRFEVTFDEWDACVAARGCEHKPETSWGRGRQPVMRVSWNDAKQYVSWLSRKTGKGYRLLTEAEWEYAARAGTTTPFSTGRTITTDQANFDGTYTYGGSVKGIDRQRTVDVGSFKPNAWGLHDMHGNVWEWVEDCWHDSYNGAPSDGSAWTASCTDASRRVLRGGSWGFDPQNLRSAYRVRYPTGNRYIDVGFRVGRTL